MLINETQQKWSNIISEELGVKDQNKLGWMSKLAQIHEIYEAQQNPQQADMGIYSTPLNTMGMGNPMMPEPAGGFQQTTGIGNTGADFHNPLYRNGSGDIPMSTLNMALEVAAMTIGLELVPVIPAPGPFAMLSYMDFPYAGGKLGRINETVLDGKGDGAENKPIYIKFNAIPSALAAIKKLNLTPYAPVEIAHDNATFEAEFIGFSRIDNNVIVEVKSVTDGAENISIADFFNTDAEITFNDNTVLNIKHTYEDWAVNTNNIVATVDGGATPTVIGAVVDNTTTTYAYDGDTIIVTVAAGAIVGDPIVKGIQLRPELVAAAADHVQGFSNFAKPQSDDPMTRAQNETGVGNTIGARMFTKLVQMGAYEVTGSVTRQQLQDMPLYGVDVIGKILEQMQNEISQAINNRILDRLFKLGVSNAVVQHQYQGLDLNLYINGDLTGTYGAEKPLSLICQETGVRFVGVDEVDHAADWGNVKNARVFAAAENVTTNQRRIMSRLLAAANVIANVSRRGRANWAVTNTQILSALQDASAFVVAPMVNTLTQDGSQSLYFAGSVCGLNIYVDPYMNWNDTRICVGRKGDGNTPGVVFMPYILCDTVQTVVEGTMAPKLLCNSRFAIVDAGFHPEQQYLTFVVDVEEGII